MSTIILANGRFPNHPIPLAELKNSTQIICCDGSVENLEAYGYQPTAIVGDLDSVSDNLKEKYSDRLFYNPDQNSNDLTKAVMWCKERGYNQITILAGTGKRDDHTIGNIGLLTKYVQLGINVKMVTDYGTFIPISGKVRLNSFEGQQVSIFSFNNETRISSKNLKYPLAEMLLPEPWMGTLNESLGNWFELDISSGAIIVYQTHN
jgi:thiamine pyrophosphokinase